MRTPICVMLAATLAPTLAAAKEPETVDVAVVRYYMPRTVVTATATLRLRDCAKPDASVDLVLSARAEADTGTPYTFDPTRLSSWRQSRDFSVTVNPNGTLAGFNSASEDKTGAIIGNILKSVVSFAGLFSAAGTPSDKCNAATADALRRVSVIRKQLAKLRPLAWKDTDPLPGEKDRALAESLAAELAAIESGALTTVIVTDLVLPAAAGDISVAWPTAPLRKWFSPVEIPASLQAIQLRVAGSPPVRTSRPQRCSQAVMVPQPALVTVQAKADANAPLMTALTVPVQQWGHVAKVCLDAPVFASRTTNVTFDAYGLMTKLDWKSNARGEAASSALATIAEQATLFKAAVKPAGETATLKDQGDLLDQQIRVEKLRRCLALLESGGTCAS